MISYLYRVLTWYKSVTTIPATATNLSGSLCCIRDMLNPPAPPPPRAPPGPPPTTEREVYNTLYISRVGAGRTKEGEKLEGEDVARVWVFMWHPWQGVFFKLKSLCKTLRSLPRLSETIPAPQPTSSMRSPANGWSDRSPGASRSRIKGILNLKETSSMHRKEKIFWQRISEYVCYYIISVVDPSWFQRGSGSSL